MSVTDLLILAFHNLMLHKVRSLLTSLGIIFGVGSVIAMMAISEGAKHEALRQIEAMGVDRIILSSRKPPQTGQEATESGNSRNTYLEYGLTHEDRAAILRMDNVLSIESARNTRSVVLSGVTKLDVSLLGVSDGFLDASRSRITEGRWFSPADRNQAVCVLGVDAKRALFPLSRKSVVGCTIPVGRHVFEVVGVLENSKGSVIPGIGSPNSAIFIPEKTSDGLFAGVSVEKLSARGRALSFVDFDTLLVRVADVAYIDHTARRISGYLRKVHREKRDWEIFVPLEILRQREQTQNIFTIVMSSIAGISLLVGGIGIMNIMLANVYERRKEIGTRRALGAQKSDVIWQFLTETVFLTSAGGAAGVLLGYGIAEAVSAFASWPVLFSTDAVLLSLIISAVTGIVFGTYPAWKAAQQNPIDVLRSE